MNDLVNGLFNFFISIFTIILQPIQGLIDTYIPSFNDFANEIGPFFNLINSSWIPWIKDLLFIPQWAFDLVLAFLVFKIACGVAVNVIKLTIKYWDVLVP